MPHFRIDPMTELETLTRKMKKFVEDFPDQFSIEIGGKFEPRVDLFHDESFVTLFVEVPGVHRDGCSITIEDGFLTVSGDKCELTEKQGCVSVRSERAYGSFKRTFQLPFRIRQDNAVAALADGVLSIRLQKAANEPHESFRISIDT
jgi:HSP20 family protein